MPENVDVESLEREALRLGREERARLAATLLESLDPLPAAPTEPLWLDVAERRAVEIDQGQVELVTPE